MGRREPVRLPTVPEGPAHLRDDRQPSHHPAADIHRWRLDPAYPQHIPGFSPWSYGPAYIVHDRLFEQHRCSYPRADQISFDDSARILGEVIDTLMREGIVPPDPRARWPIEAGARTPFACQLWDVPPIRTNCRKPAVASLRRAAPEGPTIVQMTSHARDGSVRLLTGSAWPPSTGSHPPSTLHPAIEAGRQALRARGHCPSTFETSRYELVRNVGYKVGPRPSLSRFIMS